MRQFRPGDFILEMPVGTQFPAVKLGRNDPCYCGSGKKYKKCHIDAEKQVQVLPRAVVEEAARQEAAHHARLEAHRARHGHAREPVTAMVAGRRVVAVRNRLYFEPENSKIRTFHEFLIQYVRGTFGEPWRQQQQSLPEDERHPAFRMHSGMMAFVESHPDPPDEDGIHDAPWNGDVGALLTLAWDLYTVHDHADVQARLLERLRNAAQYQGARYELYAAATCVRAGFSIAYEDEGDVTTKHPELVATHKDTGLRVAVEAKSRHRDGVLGFTPPTRAAPVVDQQRPNVHRLVIEALKKAPGKPFVIFVDVNLPDNDPPAAASPSWHDEVHRSLELLPAELRPRGNLVLVTNFPFHYAPQTVPGALGGVGSYLITDPALPVDVSILQELVRAAPLGMNVPADFPRRPIV
jgi:hypothetical protein